MSNQGNSKEQVVIDDFGKLFRFCLGECRKILEYVFAETKELIEEHFEPIREAKRRAEEEERRLAEEKHKAAKALGLQMARAQCDHKLRDRAYKLEQILRMAPAQPNSPYPNWYHGALTVVQECTECGHKTKKTVTADYNPEQLTHVGHGVKLIWHDKGETEDDG